MAIKFNKQKINTFLQYILVFFIVLESRSIFSRLLNNYLNTFIIINLILVLLLIIVLNFRSKIQKQYVLFIIMYYIFMLPFLLISAREYMINFIIIFLILLPLFFIIFCLYKVSNIHDLAKIYVDTIFVLSIISIFFYISGSLLKLIPTNIHVVIDWGGVREVSGYFYLHFNSQTTVIMNETILRNTGIFVEGPMFALHLMFAMVLSLKRHRKILDKYSIVFGITIFSTLSITGILYYLFILLYKYIVFYKAKIKVILLPVIFISILISSMILFTDKQSTNSYNIRNDDYSVGFHVFNEYPIFGSGFLNYDIVKKYMSAFRMYNTGLSSSFIIILTQGGIYLTLFYLIPMVINYIKLYSNRKTNIVLFQLMSLQLYLMFSSTYQYSSLMMILLAFDYYILISNKKNIEIIGLERKEIL